MEFQRCYDRLRMVRKRSATDDPEDFLQSKEDSKKPRVDHGVDSANESEEADVNESMGDSSDEEEFYDDYSIETQLPHFSDNNLENKRKTDLNESLVLSNEGLKQEMNKIVSQIEQQLSIPSSLAVLLLKQFSWNTERLLETYFDKPPEYFSNLGIYLPNNEMDENGSGRTFSLAQQQLISDDNEIDCAVCYVTFRPSAVAQHSHCGHVICGDCSVEYLKSRICGGTMDSTIRCAITDCNAILDDNYVYGSLKLHHDVLEAYEKLSIDDFVIKNPNIKYCPYPSCEGAWRIEPDFTTLIDDNDIGSEILCKCRENFCVVCGESWHFPMKCHLNKIWKQRMVDDSETANWIKVNAKICPNPQCEATIEKNGGCNHMQCRKCHFEFCWICMIEWSKHRGDSYNCNRAISTKDEDDKAKLKNHMHRFAEASDKFSIHGHSYKLERRLLDTADERIEQIQQLNPSFTTYHVMWYVDAINVLLACRRLLQHSFAFMFYLEESSQVDIFSTNMNNLHSSIETLSGYLEQDMDPKKLGDNQQKVLNLASFCKQRRTVVIEHVREGYQRSTWKFRKELLVSSAGK